MFGAGNFFITTFIHQNTMYFDLSNPDRSSYEKSDQDNQCDGQIHDFFHWLLHDDQIFKYCVK